jgi:hypothetical protein
MVKRASIKGKGKSLLFEEAAKSIKEELITEEEIETKEEIKEKKKVGGEGRGY